VNRRVLVVEDDEPIGRAVVDALTAHGYLIELCADGASATTALANAAADLVLLDAGLPDVDGFTLCRQIRESYPDLPIVLVTARDSEIDIVVGLDAGANDYVTKPFSMNILLARVRAHLRTADPPDPDAAIELGSLRVEPASYVASVHGMPVELRPREFQLLVVLSRAAGRVVTRERLLADVWDLHWESSTKTLDMHVLALRRKLGDAIEIATVRGVGYRLVAP
jgi:DNA-binding response OmpR family regulator